MVKIRAIIEDEDSNVEKIMFFKMRYNQKLTIRPVKNIINVDIENSKYACELVVELFRVYNVKKITIRNVSVLEPEQTSVVIYWRNKVTEINYLGGIRLRDNIEKFVDKIGLGKIDDIFFKELFVDLVMSGIEFKTTNEAEIVSKVRQCKLPQFSYEQLKERFESICEKNNRISENIEFIPCFYMIRIIIEYVIGKRGI